MRQKRGECEKLVRSKKKLMLTLKQYESRESWRWLDAGKRSNEVEKEGRWIA